MGLTWDGRQRRCSALHGAPEAAGLQSRAAPEASGPVRSRRCHGAWCSGWDRLVLMRPGVRVSAAPAALSLSSGKRGCTLP
ncbi:hypothetical protein NDU88_007647 [Pleurodeles waltl]|uniref:Uncharacterized protein n=1 Tax=Pleurodeles waltl TaxID=8319 RepID=A0AAV7VTG7_PLEWA|nr:hypothetical protein NDU88_007647 [Pleurodeles waltl]